MESFKKLLRELIKEELDSFENEELSLNSKRNIPKGQWVALQPGTPEFETVQNHLYDLVNNAYAGMEGGHIKITGQGTESLNRYRYWLAIDHANDDEIDLTIFGKPEFGTKSAGVGHDGSQKSIKTYKDKGAELRSGGSVEGIGNWWGEVSGKAAYALLSRGAPAIESEAEVAKLLDGDRYEWHGAHPDPNAPALFKGSNGWYTKWFGNTPHTKIIIGNPN